MLPLTPLTTSYLSPLRFLFIILLCLICGYAGAQSSPSVAREWNEVYLYAIRNDLARPVVHARNLYHSSAAMYDAWALVYRRGTTALVARPADLPTYADRQAVAEEAISLAAYGLLRHRYGGGPKGPRIIARADSLLTALGYAPTISTDYRSGAPAALGNYVAQRIIAYGSQDGANEAFDYANTEYPDARNAPLDLARPFSILNLRFPNFWQPLTFPGSVIDQSGNPIGSTPGFLGASWGRVTPFAIPDSARQRPIASAPIYGNSPVYHDPGPPPQYDLNDSAQLDDYRWNFETVLRWSGHLDPSDGVNWNISPGARGNAPKTLPSTPAEYREWYDAREGGQPGTGHPVNPVTGEPYTDNIVPRGDYTRVLAEFWADGPASETPPGHWFAIFNYAMDHPLFERRLGGVGPVLPDLEYDVKAYLALGGAMHDAAVTAWSIKGKYDYIRPISAIRYLASQGQASLPDAPGYNPGGMRLDPGYIELATSPDEVVNFPGLLNVKARAWVGNSFINDATTDAGGVDWINPSAWEPYQRPNFVTPNFAAYVSGHSTFSSAAATVLTALTGTPYFPGGLGEFVAKKDAFLVFERGPSVDVVLQWATYDDAAAETSLSRIWGGIHPPADDIPGRRIGRIVGTDAYRRAESLFADTSTSVSTPSPLAQTLRVYPNPVTDGASLRITSQAPQAGEKIRLVNTWGQTVAATQLRAGSGTLPTQGLPPGLYVLVTQTGQRVTNVVVR